jgi:hypothetical protein
MNTGEYTFNVHRRTGIEQVRIIVEMPEDDKTYLGGFKNVTNGLVYLHSFSQTDQLRRIHPIKCHRDTQTHEYSSKSCNTHKEFGTQVERTGLWIDKRKDVGMQANKYFTSEMWQERRELAAHFIQKMFRGCFARKRTNELRRQKELKKQEQIDTEKNFRKHEEEKHEREIRRRIHPKTKDDFEILYQELELWRTNETNKIKKNPDLSEEMKKIAMKQLLEKEIELLQTIDRLKIQANKENREEKIQSFLKSMADPKRWLRSDGRTTNVTTPFTTRADELMQIYNGLKMKSVSLDERLDILLNTKFTVLERRYEKISDEIEELINREADMINRGRPEPSLEGLRQRLCNLFLQYIENPKMNPEAARFQKIPIELLERDLKKAKLKN